MNCWALSIARAIPKSSRVTWSSVPTMTLVGLTSRWMTPCWWAKSSASASGRSRRIDPVDRERLVGADDLAQRAPLDEVHHDVVVVVLLADVVDQDDVRVAQPGRDRRLALEPRDEALVGGEVGRQELDGAELLEVSVAGTIDDAHPAAPERLQEVVRPDAARARSIQRSYPPWTSAPGIIHDTRLQIAVRATAHLSAYGAASGVSVPCGTSRTCSS